MAHGHVGDQHAYLAEPDDPEGLAGHLRTCELRFALLDPLVHLLGVRNVADRIHPGESLRNVAQSQPETDEHELGNRVGIGTRRIEYAHADSTGLVDGDVVHAGSGAGHRQSSREQIGIDLRGPHDDGIGSRLAVTDGVLVAKECKPLR